MLRERHSAARCILVLVTPTSPSPRLLCMTLGIIYTPAVGHYRTRWQEGTELQWCTEMSLTAKEGRCGAMRDQDVVEVLYKGLTIVNTLLAWAGRTVSRRDLADKTGLAPKQVGRYLNTLEALGFPLKQQRRGTEDMVAMQRDVQKRLRLLPFTTEELM